MRDRSLNIITLLAAVILSACASIEHRADFASPSDGAILAAFGQPYGAAVSEGIYFGLEAGAPIRASANGKVIFARAWSPVGAMIIVDHTHGLYTFYSGKIIFTVEEAEAVAKGQTIATGAPAEGENPALSFEIRRDGKPLDPGKLIAGF